MASSCSSFDDPSIDIRGVKRGKCTICDCTQFVRGQESLCARSSCQHVPVKHVNHNNPVLESQRETSPVHYQGTPSQSHQMNYQHVSHSPSYSNVVTGVSRMTTSTTTSNYQDRNWPTCSTEGCNEFAYYDRHLGFFSFCSPACRDKSALPAYDEKLRKDIEKFKVSGDYRDIMLPSSVPQHETTQLRDEVIELLIITKPKEESGFLFCKDEELNQAVITGAESPEAMELLEKGTVHLYDIVLKVMDIEIKSVAKIEEIVKPKTEIRFSVRRHPYIQLDLSNFFKKAKHKKIVLIKYTVAMRKFGVKVESYDKTLQVENDSIAYRSGLRRNEKLKYYASTSDTEIKEIVYAFMTTDRKINGDFGQCRDNKLHLLLAVD